jgi:adenine/guanine/hypoxanthine permease
MAQRSFNPPWFVRKDLDGFFGLMIDNLIQLILIVALCRELIRLPDEYIFGKILPGAAISVLVGNFFYAWQARQLALRTGRDDVTALPYGINTVSLFAFVFFIMLPIVQETKDPVWAWKVGLVACFLNGVIEIVGAFIAEAVRRVTPRAALLSALAGIAITFISMDFTFKIFAQPLVALVPMAVIFIAYFSQQRLPLGLPGGMVAIAIGTLAGWLLGTMDGKASIADPSLSLPAFTGGSLWEALAHPAFLNYFSVILPMGVFNVVGSLQNIESAEAAGDRFRTFPSLTANGFGSVVAALFGSVFPTTIYIGHPGWKRLGARSGYSALNGLFIAFLCLTGTIQSVLAIIPLEAGVGILLYIGIVMVAQAFQETPKEHAPAVALGLVPAEGACARGGIGTRAGARRMGSADDRNRTPRGGHVALSSRFGEIRARKRRRARHDFLGARLYFYFDDSARHRCGPDRAKIHPRGCLGAGRGAAFGIRRHSCLRAHAGRHRQPLWRNGGAGIFPRVFVSNNTVFRNRADREK